MAASAAPQMDPQQLNLLARQAVLARAVNMSQSVFQQTVFPPSNPVLQMNPRNVGLIKSFTIVITATLNNTGGSTATLTDYGPSNLIKQVTYVDLNNNTRIQTDGRHLTLLASEKRRRSYGSSADVNAVATNNRSQVFNVPPASWGILQAPPTIGTGASGTVRAVFELPLAYADNDLRGAVYANVVNATQQIQITFNQNAFAASGDLTSAVYGGSAGTFTSATVQIYQNYLDQLPQGKNGVILPTLDLSTVYELKQTTFSAMTPTQDFQIPYANFRDFYSVLAVFNNNGTTGRTYDGTDINYWALQSANFTNIWKFDPLTLQQRGRDVLGSDIPAGSYYISHRNAPINTTQYGNMELILNPITATGSAYCLIYWEDMALTNTLTQAGSLA